MADGEWGNLTVTTLDRDNGLLRYDLEEACAILRGPCPCGETSIRGLWGGRFKDLLSCQGTRFQLNELEGVLRGIEAVRPRRSSTRWSGPTAPTHRWSCGSRWPPRTPATAESARQRVETDVREALGVVVAVEVLDRDTIPRAGYKATRVIEP